jgi:hypothetical protein
LVALIFQEALNLTVSGLINEVMIVLLKIEEGVLFYSCETEG